MTSGSKKKTETEKLIQEEDDVFQAVLLADNFENYVLGKNCPYLPEGLISLGNRKLIDYSLEALTKSGVHEIFVYSTRNSADLKEHIRLSKWSNLSNTIITSVDTLSLGDALRDLDAKDLLRKDFILLQSGVVTNLELRPLLDKHREIVKGDKGAVISLVHRKMLPGHRSRSKNPYQNPVIVVDSKTNRVVSYDIKVPTKKITIPLESMRPEMEMYLDTCDTGIAICSSIVPFLFTDNFDFTNMDDFIRQMLNDEMMENIYYHRIEKGYANRVVDFETYKGISLDVLQRWTYPLVPDMPFGSGISHSTYSFNHNFTYKGQNIKIERSTEVGPLVLIGHSSEIGKNSSVQNSCLGDNCKIGMNVKIVNSFIGNNVTIEDGIYLQECFVSDDTVIKGESEIKPWTLVNKESITRMDLPNEISKDDEDSSSEDDDVIGIQEEDFTMFSSEIFDNLVQTFQENVETENLVLEINSLKSAYDMEWKDIIVALLKGVLSLPVQLSELFPDVKFHEKFPLKIQWEKTKESIMKFKDLFLHYVKNEDAQLDLLTALEEYANDHVYFRPLLSQTLKLFYDEDVLIEEIILSWYHKESLYKAGKELRVLVQKFVDWLEATESDDDDE